MNSTPVFRWFRRLYLLLAVMLLVGAASSAAAVTFDSAIDYAAATKNKYTGKTYAHAPKFANCEIVHGVDVSKYQGLKINWTKVKADGIDFAFLRIGHSWWASDANGNIRLGSDESFETNYRNARAAGVAVGVYYYSQATTVSEAHKESAYVLKLMRERSLDLPIVFDSESPTSSRLYKANVSKAKMTKIAAAFCKDVTDAGYQAMIYGGLTKFNTKLDAVTLAKTYPLWFARYNTNTYYNGPYTFWQYASGAKVNGISGTVDVNFWYKPKDYVTSSAVASIGQVSGLQVTRTGTSSLSLSFNGVANAASYEIFRAESYDGLYEKIATITSTSYADTGLLPCREYYYQVRAIKKTDGVTIYGELSDIVWQSTASVSSYQVKTTASANIREHAGALYDKVTTLSSGKTLTLLAITRNADADVWYHVSFTSGGTQKEGYVSGKTAGLKIGKVKGLIQKKATARTISLSWNAVNHVDGYRVYGSETRNGEMKLLATVPASKTRCKIGGLEKYAQYYFRVCSYVKLIEADDRSELQVSEGSLSSRLAAETRHFSRKLTAKTKLDIKKYAGGKKKVMRVAKGTAMTADYRAKDSDGNWWYHVTATYKNKTKSGYVSAALVKKVK